MPTYDSKGNANYSQQEIEEWIKTADEEFYLDAIRKELGLRDDTGNPLRKILARLAEKGVVRKLGRGWYRKIERSRPINFLSVPSGDSGIIQINYPTSQLDDSSFGFGERVVTRYGGIHIIAGVSNKGKTTWALNVLVENMNDHHCRYISSEFNEFGFLARLKKFDWVDYIDEEGQPKFEVVKPTKYFQDAVLPNSINIIDWINMDDSFFKIGGIIEEIQGVLDKGMAIIMLQKGEGKELGAGGQFSEHNSSLYLTIDTNRLFVRKLKEPIGKNLEGKHFGFYIHEGTKFHDIREVRICNKCKGLRKFPYGTDTPCPKCSGKGFREIWEMQS